MVIVHGDMQQHVTYHMQYEVFHAMLGSREHMTYIYMSDIHDDDMYMLHVRTFFF